MKIIVVGGSGTIGTAIVKELSKRNEIITVSKNRGEIKCDMTSGASIQDMFKKIGKIDAVVVASGNVHFEDFAGMTDEKYRIGLQSKLMGQVNLVVIGKEFLNDRGSFTLTSGVLSHDPIKAGTSASMVNGAIDSFVKAAAIEMPRGIRINSVSPTVVLESMDKFGPFFLGYKPVPVVDVALAYSKSVEGLQTGQVFTVGF